MVKEETINIFDTPSETTAIAHQCNCFCTMGSGIAKLIAELYPEAEETDGATHAGDAKKLGTYTISRNDKDGRVIYNVYGQFEYGGAKPTNYEALYNGLLKVKNSIESRNSRHPEKPKIHLAIPYGIGSMRGGASWRVVRTMIEVIFEDADFTVTICRLPGQEDLK